MFLIAFKCVPRLLWQLCFPLDLMECKKEISLRLEHCELFTGTEERLLWIPFASFNEQFLRNKMAFRGKFSLLAFHTQFSKWPLVDFSNLLRRRYASITRWKWTRGTEGDRNQRFLIFNIARSSLNEWLCWFDESTVRIFHWDNFPQYFPPWESLPGPTVRMSEDDSLGGVIKGRDGLMSSHAFIETMCRNLRSD